MLYVEVGIVLLIFAEFCGQLAMISSDILESLGNLQRDYPAKIRQFWSQVLLGILAREFACTSRDIVSSECNYESEEFV